LSDLIVAPETRDLGELAAAMAGWLAGKLPQARNLRVDNLDYPRGAGMSHETVLFDAHWQEDGRDVSQGMVVRIKPEKMTVFPDNLFDEQYALMRELHAGDYVRVARVLWLEHDPGLLGKPFFVMERKYGRVPVSMPPYAQTGWVSELTDAQHRKMWEEAVTQLALIQRVPLDKVQFLRGPAHAPDGFAQEWDKYVRFVEWVKDLPQAPILRAALDRLDRIAPANRPEGLVWGDARIGNMMFGDDLEVIAVMDWEQPSLGGALHDLAWFLVLSETMHGRSAQRGRYLPGMGTREETIALWEEISGKSAADIEWYEEFTHLKMACTGVRLGQLRGEEMQPAEYLKKRLKVG
jgi:aminoglycoside phosphotransferase (APT) family kinase protein